MLLSSKEEPRKANFLNFTEIKAKFYHHLFDVWSLCLDEQEATHKLQASCSTYITEEDYTFFFFLLLRLKMLFTHLTVGWAAFQLAVYCGISPNNHATQVKCLQSFKHFILRASSGNRQARQKKKINKKTRQKMQMSHSEAPQKRQSAFKMF